MPRTASYQPVQPVTHDAACRRGQDPAGPHYGLDRERCERCRALWQRLDDAGAARRAAIDCTDPRD